MNIIGDRPTTKARNSDDIEKKRVEKEQFIQYESQNSTGHEMKMIVVGDEWTALISLLLFAI